MWGPQPTAKPPKHTKTTNEAYQNHHQYQPKHTKTTQNIPKPPPKHTKTISLFKKKLHHWPPTLSSSTSPASAPCPTSVGNAPPPPWLPPSRPRPGRSRPPGAPASPPSPPKPGAARKPHAAVGPGVLLYVACSCLCCRFFCLFGVGKYCFECLFRKAWYASKMSVAGKRAPWLGFLFFFKCLKSCLELLKAKKNN